MKKKSIKIIIFFLSTILACVLIYFFYSQIEYCNISIENNSSRFAIKISDQKKFMNFNKSIINCENNSFIGYIYNPQVKKVNAKNIKIIFTDTPQKISIRNNNWVEFTYFSYLDKKKNEIHLYLHPNNPPNDSISFEEHIYNIFSLELSYLINGDQSSTNYKNNYPNFEAIGLSYENW